MISISSGLPISLISLDRVRLAIANAICDLPMRASEMGNASRPGVRSLMGC